MAPRIFCLTAYIRGEAASEGEAEDLSGASPFSALPYWWTIFQPVRPGRMGGKDPADRPMGGCRLDVGRKGRTPGTCVWRRRERFRKFGERLPALG